MPRHSAAMPHALAGRGASPRPGWGARILTLLNLRRSRIDLGHLSDEQLHDIGLTHEDVREELARPIWDVPRNWRRN